MQRSLRKVLGIIAVACSALAFSAGESAEPASPATATTDPLALVDPELRAVVAPGSRMAVGYDFNEATLKLMRQMSATPAAKSPASALPEERSIAGPEGAPPVRVFVVSPPSKSKQRPAVLHIHGGGYVIGSAAGSVPNMRRLAEQLDAVVITVEYRLAPETKYPGSLEDNYAALKWVYANAEELGIDRTRIALLGESAGGGHAAALSIAARDRGEIPIVAQVLIYPMLDDRTGSVRDAPPHVGTFIWTRKSNNFGWTSLLGVPAGSAQVPDGAVPARVSNLKGLPPTWIGVGALDLFVQEDMEFARRLMEAEVQTELHVVPGAYHGFDIFAPQTKVAQQFTASWTSALQRALARPENSKNE